MLINNKPVGFRRFSTKVIVMTIVISCVVLPLLIGLLIYRETNFLAASYYRRGQDMLAGVREASRIALLGEDTQRLAGIAGEMMKHRQEILYLVFYDAEWQTISPTVAAARFGAFPAQSMATLQQELAAGEATWAEEVIRDRRLGELPVTEFWTRLSSSEIGELEMLAGSAAEADRPRVERVSGYICLGVSRQELTGTIGRIWRDALVAGVLTLLIMSVATAWLLKRLMAPFAELVDGVQAVAGGDMERTISVRSQDEVSTLADEFNKMVVALKEWQKRLLESESRFRSLFTRTHSGILIIDENGDILDSNPAMAKMVGCEEMASLTSAVLASFFKNPGDAAMLLRRIRQERDIQGMQLVLVNRKTGREVETNVSVTSQTDVHGNYQYAEVVFVDITHIAELEKRLLHAQKMEAVGTLAGGIAHDFNNILTVITGRIALIGMDATVRDNPKLCDNLHSIEQSVGRATDLVGQILGFARKGMYKEEVLNLNKVVTAVRTLLAETIDRRIEIRVDLAAQLWPVKGDEGQIFQSLLNICLNGCDAMPDGGLLAISTGCLASDQEMPLAGSIMAPGHYVFIKVADSGIGMDEEAVAKIFDPFFTTKEVGKGTGLGMAMVHGIISNHRGHLRVASRKGEGTVVTVYLPALREKMDRLRRGDAGDSILLAEEPGPGAPCSFGAAATPGAEEAGETNPPPRKAEGMKTVLLVDDERTILRVNTLFFGELPDYHLVTAASGEEAVEMVKKDRAAVDLIVMDLSMPGMGGEKAFREIHALHPDLPVIIATGFADDSMVNRLLAAGAVDLVLKPYTGAELVRVLNMCAMKKGETR